LFLTFDSDQSASNFKIIETLEKCSSLTYLNPDLLEILTTMTGRHHFDRHPHLDSISFVNVLFMFMTSFILDVF